MLSPCWPFPNSQQQAHLGAFASAFGHHSRSAFLPPMPTDLNLPNNQSPPSSVSSLLSTSTSSCHPHAGYSALLSSYGYYGSAAAAGAYPPVPPSLLYPQPLYPMLGSSSDLRADSSDRHNHRSDHDEASNAFAASSSSRPSPEPCGRSSTVNGEDDNSNSDTNNSANSVVVSVTRQRVPLASVTSTSIFQSNSNHTQATNGHRATHTVVLSANATPVRSAANSSTTSSSTTPANVAVLATGNSESSSLWRPY